MRSVLFYFYFILIFSIYLFYFLHKKLHTISFLIFFHYSAAVGGFFFLRFVCPAVAGHSDLPPLQAIRKNFLSCASSSSLSPTALERGFVLVSKILQCLSNRTGFSRKEVGVVMVHGRFRKILTFFFFVGLYAPPLSLPSSQ